MNHGSDPKAPKAMTNKLTFGNSRMLPTGYVIERSVIVCDTQNFSAEES
jgi:hypothetical protein